MLAAIEEPAPLDAGTPFATGSVSIADLPNIGEKLPFGEGGLPDFCARSARRACTPHRCESLLIHERSFLLNSGLAHFVEGDG